MRKMMDDFKKEILKMSSEELIGMHNSIMDLIYGYGVSSDMDAESYERYWRNDRPEYLAKLKIVENELSYRSIII